MHIAGQQSNVQKLDFQENFSKREIGNLKNVFHDFKNSKVQIVLNCVIIMLLIINLTLKN